MPRMNYNELALVNWIEEYWHENSGYPPVGRIKEEFPEIDYRELKEREEFKLALKNRGIHIDRPSELTDEMVAAILAVTTYRDGRSTNAKLKDLGISLAQWQGWMKIPRFKKYFHARSKEVFDDSVDVAHKGLLKALDRGDVNANKFYMELTGRWTPTSTSEVNVKLVLARLIEVIQLFVDDPIKLQLIAVGFDAVMKGEPIPMPDQRLEIT